MGNSKIEEKFVQCDDCTKPYREACDIRCPRLWPYLEPQVKDKLKAGIKLLQGGHLKYPNAE